MKKRKGSSATTDLRHFLQRSAAKKKQAVEPQIVTPSTNESQMQMVVFQGQSDTGTSSVQPQPVRDEQRRPVESPIIEDYESMPQDKSESSDSDEDNNDYDIEHDPGLRVPISSYPINDRDSVRRTLIAMGPCRPKMKKNDFPQHNCGEYAVNEEGLREEQCHEPEPEDQYPGQELPEGCENEEDPDFVPEEVD